MSSSTRIPTSALGALGLQLLLAAAPGAAQSPPSFYTTHSFESDRPAGQESDAQGLSWNAESAVAQNLRDYLPCADVTGEDDAKAFIGMTKWQQIVGTESPADDPLVAVAGALGATHMVHVKVVQFGPNVGVTITVMKTGSATLVAKAVQVFPLDDEIHDRIEAMAVEVAEEVAGGLRCPAWQGSVSWKYEYHEVGERNGYPYQDDTLIEGSCTVDAWKGADALCTGRFVTTIRKRCPDGGDCGSTHRGEEEVPGQVFVVEEDGTIHVAMDEFVIEGGTGDSATVWGFTIEVPLAAGQRSISGSDTSTEPLAEDSGAAATITRTWNLAFR